MYLDNTYAPKDYRRWLSERIRPILAAHGVGLGRVDPATGSMGFSEPRTLQPGVPQGLGTGGPQALPQEQSVPTVSPLKRADPGFDQRLLRPAAAQTLF